MTRTHPTRTLGEIVADTAAAARVLDRLGLDYCCHGDRSLVDACVAAGLDPAAVVAAIEEEPSDDARDWTQLALPALVDDIVQTHHRYLRAELPELVSLSEKVLTVHGRAHPELVRVRELVAALRADLEPHLDKEELVLFPAIHELADGRRSFPFGTVAHPIRLMALEHDRAGDLLAEVRAVTSGYVTPDDGCASYRSLYERLEDLEHDTHVHIHKENHSVFPGALQLADG